MRTRLLQVVWALALFTAVSPARAVSDLNVRPNSVSSNIRLDVPTITVDPTALPARPTFRDLLGGRRLRITFSPSTFSATWIVACVDPVARSAKGEFRLNGTVIGTNTKSLSAPNCANIQRVSETVTIPETVGEAIVNRILDRRIPIPVQDFNPGRLRDALERAARDVATGLEYERTWSAEDSKTDSVAILFDAQVAGRFQLDFSRLVSFNGSTTASAVSVLGAATPIPVNWVGVVEQIGSGFPLTLRSTEVLIRSRSGNVLGQQNRPLTRGGIRSGQAFFNETINLSSTHLLGARQAGGGIVLERTLIDDFGNSFTAQIPIGLTGPAQAEFAVTAMKCRFHDGARIKIVQEGDPVNVVCVLRFDGPGGLLRGTWEVGEGAGAQPFFRPVQLYSNFVVGQNILQVSRSFIATGSGRHIVRFRVQQPTLLSDQAEIQYYVGVAPDQISAAELPSPLSVLNPPPNSIAETGLEVSWAALPVPATHVLIEFFRPEQLYEDPDPNELQQRSSALLIRGGPLGSPIAGLVVPADRSRAEISALVMEHLGGNGLLYIRVSALNEGIMVATSPLRRLNAP